MSALCYIKITAENIKFIVFSYSKSALQILLSKWDHPTVQTIMRFLVFPHTVLYIKRFYFVDCPVIWELLEMKEPNNITALDKYISECLISYTDTYQYISKYLRDLWHREWDTSVNNKLHATKPLFGEQPSAYRSVRRCEVVLSRFKLGHSYCCCLPTPITLASEGSLMFPLVVHQLASPSIWPAVQLLRRGLPTNPGVTMWCVCGSS